jgi:hypothetical protein
MASNKARGWWGYIILFGIGAFVIGWWFDAEWFLRLSYAGQYKVQAEQVTVAKKPHDCDFMQAPMGSKNCHYKPVATPFMPSEPGSPLKYNHVDVDWEKVQD